MSDRQQITAAPLPPDSFDEHQAMAWFDLVLPLMHQGKLFADKLPDIEKLAVLEAERKKLLSDVELEPRMLDYELLTTRGFDKRFESYLPKFNSYELAFEQVQFEFQLSFNHRRYTNYESFRISYGRRKKT